MPVGVAVPVEALATLRRRLVALPARHPERGVLMKSTAQLYAVSRATLYRLLRGDRRPKDTHRADRGRPRSMPAPEIERWCEIVAAMKIRTTNKKGRHLSTVRTLQLLVEHGVDTPDGFEKLATRQADRIHRQPPPAPSRLRPRADGPPTSGGPLPGRALECVVALRHEPVGPEASEGAAVD